MSNEAVKDALRYRAAGGLSLQQQPYQCPHSSFEYAAGRDVLKPVVLKPFEPSTTRSKNKTLRDQSGGPTPVPNLDDVQAFMCEPEFVENPGSELEVLLASQYIRNPYPYPGNSALLSSYSSEPLDSLNSFNLRAQVRYALSNVWKSDIMRCSVQSAIKISRDLAANPRHGLTREEYSWTIRRKLTAKKARSSARLDFEQVRRYRGWMKSADGDNEAPDIDQELDKSYGPNGTDLRPVGNDSGDEGFYEPNAITTTIFEISDNSLLEPGVTPGGIFQDSGIVMDQAYAENSHAHSLENAAKTTTAMVPTEWPTFKADVATLRSPKNKAPLLRLVGDQSQRDWPGRRQGAHDLHGLRSWVRASKSNHVEMLGEHEARNSDPQGKAGSFMPQLATREASVSPTVEAVDGHDTEATSSRISAPSVIAVPRDGNQVVDGSTTDTTHEKPLPAEVASPMESANRSREVQEVLEAVYWEMYGESFKRITQLSGQEQPSLLNVNKKEGKEVAVKERLNHTPVSGQNAENNEASVGAAQPVSEAPPQHFPGSIGNGSDNDFPVPAPHVIGGFPQVNIDANAHAHARRSIHSTAFTTPVNQRIGQIQQVQLDTPATPPTVNINLTPKYNSDMDADDASDGSLAVRLPNSPTIDTQKGQSALGRYVQQTEPHLNLARQSSSTRTLYGSGSEEVSLVPLHERPGRPEGHSGFREDVEVYQNRDAAFTDSPPKASHATPSASNAAPIPVTPANEKDSASFRPITPFQLGTPAHPYLDSPGTPTPAPKLGKGKGKSVVNPASPKANKADSKSVKNVFRSTKLGSRSPERPEPRSGIVVDPVTPTAGAFDQSHNSGKGLLFEKAKRDHTGTKGVLTNLKLSPERGNGSSVGESLEDYEDELADDNGVDASKAGKSAQQIRRTTNSRPVVPRAGRTVAQAVVVPSVRPRDENDTVESEENLQIEEQPRKKKLRRSTRGGAGCERGTLSRTVSG